MATRGHGRFVLIASASVFGVPGASPYAIGKISMLALARTMHLEAVASGINIKTNAVAPLAFTGQPVRQDFLHDKFGSRVHPDNVAAAIVWLVSRSCELSGSCLRVGGTYLGQIVLGLTHGWASGADRVTPEDIAGHVEEAFDLHDMTTPDSAAEVTAQMYRRVLQVSGGD